MLKFSDQSQTLHLLVIHVGGNRISKINQNKNKNNNNFGGLMVFNHPIQSRQKLADSKPLDNH